MLLRRGDSAAIVADGAILTIVFLLPYATTELLLAGVYMNDPVPVSTVESECRRKRRVSPAHRKR